MKAILTYYGVLVSYNEIIKRLSMSELLNELTISTPQDIGQNKIAHIYRFTVYKGVKYLCLPRNFAVSMIKYMIVDELIQYPFEIQSREDSNKTYNNVLQMDPNQQIIVDYLMREIYNANNKMNGSAVCTLHMKAGHGKTFCALQLIRLLNVPTLVIVPSKHILRQWVDASAQYLGVQTDIMIINTALLKESSYFWQFKFIIFDEIHLYCSQRRQNIFWRCQAPLLLGLTATPFGRKDKFDKIAHLQTGRVITAETIPNFNPRQLVFAGDVVAINYYGPRSHTQYITNEKTQRLDSGKTIKQLLADPFRAKLLYSVLVEIMHKFDFNIYVFTDRCEHAKEILLSLQNIGISDAGIMFGKSTDKERTETMQKRIIITTYGYAGCGVSINRMDCIVFGTPRRSGFFQIVPRITRKGGDVIKRRLIIDIVDKKTGLKGQFIDREYSYNEQNFNVLHADFAWDNEYETMIESTLSLREAVLA